MPYEQSRSANGAAPLPPSAAAPAARQPVTSPVADFVNEVMTGRLEPPPLVNWETANHSPILEGKQPPQADPSPIRKAIPPFKMAPDNPPPKPGSNEALLDAIDKVYRAAKERIAYHERELEKLRAALSPFGHIEAPMEQSANTAESLIQSLVAAAGQLQEQPK